ncbi:hypothetical protein LJR098_003498 [Rhizobium sp. LjRoot98]|uniref:hypothetical protein n=1 Tax=Rhizobium sp. LjRoot98 TaxID=3342345 RepID=UPI003ECF2248
MSYRNPTKIIGGLSLVSILLAFGSMGVASAQTSNAPGTENCAIDSDSAKDKSVTGKLDECNSVLVPPKVGDSEIIAPSEATGSMPVIKPGELPTNRNP